MNRCPRCERPVRYWRLSCRLCGQFIWRLPHVVILVLLILILIVIIIWIIERLPTY